MLFDRVLGFVKKSVEIILPVNLRIDLYSRIKSTNYPYEYTFSDLADVPCKFEVSGPVEEFRVVKMGGETQFTHQILSLIKPDDIVFDIGSCVGVVAIPAALRGAKVSCFEPDPILSRRLKKNIGLNNLTDKMKVIEWAVADQEGKLDLYTEGIEGVSPSLARIGKRDSISISTNSIDNAIAQGQLPKPNIIKLDVEGAEILALRGMKDLLESKQAPRLLFCEFHPKYLKYFGSDQWECINLIKNAGYGETYWKDRYKQIHAIYQK